MIQSTDSVSDSGATVPPAAMEIVTPQPSSPPTQGTPHKSAFTEQIALLPDSLQGPLLKQLELMPEETIYKIVDTHEGGASILYKTYGQAKEARARKDSIANLQGDRVFAEAKARLGNTYYLHDGSGTATFTMGSLAEFQVTGLLVVMIVIVSLCILTYAMAAIFKALGFSKPTPPAAAAAAPAPVRPAAPPALDPNAPSVHPGFNNGQLQAFLSVAAAAALDASMSEPVHPGISNEKLAVIFATAAAEILGGPCSVVKFRPMNAMDWTWTVQGHAELHSNRLR